VGRMAQKPKTIPSRWPLDRRGKIELHPTHFGRFNTLEGAELLRLDDWTAQEQPQSIDFVKMDVDGYEIDVVEGAGQTLPHYKPVMMMEFTPYIFSERGRSFLELLEALSALGYRARTVSGKGLALEPALEAAIPRGGSMNVILEAL
jgi:methyltransferase FkbM-like protein